MTLWARNKTPQTVRLLFPLKLHSKWGFLEWYNKQDTVSVLDEILVFMWKIWSYAGLK